MPKTKTGQHRDMPAFWLPRRFLPKLWAWSSVSLPTAVFRCFSFLARPPIYMTDRSHSRLFFAVAVGGDASHTIIRMDPVRDPGSISSTSQRLTHMLFTGGALCSEVQPSLAAFSTFTLLPPVSGWFRRILVLGKGRTQLSPGVFNPIGHSMIGDLPDPKSTSTRNPSRCPRRGRSGHGIH